MIIYFKETKTFINTDNILRIDEVCTEVSNKPRIRFWHVDKVYDHTFWNEKDYPNAMKIILDGFKKNKRYVEIDG